MTKKQLLVIGASLLSIMLLLSVMLMLSGLKKPVIKPPFEIFPTPTPVNTNITLPHTSMGSSFPPNNMTGIGTNTVISYTFPASLSAQEKNNVSLQVSPSTPGSLSWDRNTITFTPDSPLTTSQKYTVILINGQNQQMWSFTTSPVAIDPNNAAAEQEAGDKLFGQITQRNAKDFPWLNNFPINTSSYFVIFDVNSRTFEATLYPNTKSTLSISNQVTNLKSEILQALLHLNIPVSQYPFNWTITPVSE